MRIQQAVSAKTVHACYNWYTSSGATAACSDWQLVRVPAVLCRLVREHVCDQYTTASGYKTRVQPKEIVRILAVTRMRDA